MDENTLLSRAGIKKKDIAAIRIVVYTKEKILTFDNPKFSMVTLQGVESYGIVGTPKEEMVNDRL